MLRDPRRQKILLVVLLLVAGLLGSRSYRAYQDVVASEQLFEQAESLQHRGDMQGALQTYQQAYARNPQYFPAYEAAADLYLLYFREGRKAVAVLEDAYRQLPDDRRVHRALGECYLTTRLPEFRVRAVEQLARAAQEDPQDATCAALLARARQAAAGSAP